MITDEDRKLYSKVLGEQPSGKIADYFNEISYRNKWGKPWTSQAVYNYWSGKYNDPTFEYHLLDLVVKEQSKSELYEEKKQLLKSKLIA